MILDAAAAEYLERSKKNKRIFAMKTSGAKSSFAAGNREAPRRRAAAALPPASSPRPRVPSMSAWGPAPPARTGLTEGGQMSRSMMLRLSGRSSTLRCP